MASGRKVFEEALAQVGQDAILQATYAATDGQQGYESDESELESLVSSDDDEPAVQQQPEQLATASDSNGDNFGPGELEEELERELRQAEVAAANAARKRKADEKSDAESDRLLAADEIDIDDDEGVDALEVSRGRKRVKVSAPSAVEDADKAPYWEGLEEGFDQAADEYAALEDAEEAPAAPVRPVTPPPGSRQTAEQRQAYKAGRAAWRAHERSVKKAAEEARKAAARRERQDEAARKKAASDAAKEAQRQEKARMDAAKAMRTKAEISADTKARKRDRLAQMKAGATSQLMNRALSTDSGFLAATRSQLDDERERVKIRGGDVVPARVDGEEQEVMALEDLPKAYHVHPAWSDGVRLDLLLPHMDLQTKIETKTLFKRLGLDEVRGRNVTELVYGQLLFPGHQLHIPGELTDANKMKVAVYAHALLVVARWGYEVFSVPSLALKEEDQVRWSTHSTEIFMLFSVMLYKAAKRHELRRAAKLKSKGQGDSGDGGESSRNMGSSPTPSTSFLSTSTNPTSIGGSATSPINLSVDKPVDYMGGAPTNPITTNSNLAFQQSMSRPCPAPPDVRIDYTAAFSHVTPQAPAQMHDASGANSRSHVPSDVRVQMTPALQQIIDEYTVGEANDRTRIRSQLQARARTDITGLREGGKEPNLSRTKRSILYLSECGVKATTKLEMGEFDMYQLGMRWSFYHDRGAHDENFDREMYWKRDELNTRCIALSGELNLIDRELWELRQRSDNP